MFGLYLLFRVLVSAVVGTALVAVWLTACLVALVEGKPMPRLADVRW